MTPVIDSLAETLSEERRTAFESEMYSEIREGMVIGVLIAHDPFGIGYDIDELYNAYNKARLRLSVNSRTPNLSVSSPTSWSIENDVRTETAGCLCHGQCPAPVRDQRLDLDQPARRHHG